MNKLLFAAGAVFLGPPLLRALAGRPDLLKSGADLLEKTGATAVALGKKGYAYGRDVALPRVQAALERRAGKAGVSGLGFEPDRHRAEGRMLAEVAVQHAQEAEGLARAGLCKAAFRRNARAHAGGGSVHAHAGAAGVDPARAASRVAAAVKQADAAFAKHCLVGGGNAG